MVTVFWDARGIIYTDYLVKGQCTGAQLRSFDRQNYGIKIRFITTSTVFTRFALRWLFFFSRNLEKWLDGQRFTSNEEVIAQTDASFEDLPKSYFLDGFKKLDKRLGKCVELKGDYVEKYKKIYTK